MISISMLLCGTETEMKMSLLGKIRGLKSNGTVFFAESARQ